MEYTEDERKCADEIFKVLNDVERKMLKEGGMNSNIIHHISQKMGSRVGIIKALMAIAQEDVHYETV